MPRLGWNGVCEERGSGRWGLGLVFVFVGCWGMEKFQIDQLDR
jgi:hypothetical protein